MNPTSTSLCVFVLLCMGFMFISALPEPQAEPEGEVAEEEKSCQKWIFDLVSLLFDALGPCVAGGGWGIKGFHEIFTRLFCLVKCILSELGLLDDQMKLDGAAAAVFFGDYFPTDLRNQILVKAEPCFPLAEGFNQNEYHCKSYAGFAQCAGVAVAGAMLPYVVGCFGGPFASFALNGVFSFLTSLTPSGRSGDDSKMRMQMSTLWEPKNQIFLPNRKGHNDTMFRSIMGSA